MDKWSYLFTLWTIVPWSDDCSIRKTNINTKYPKRLEKILKKFKVNILYVPVTLIRLLKNVKYDLNISTKYLKTLGSMGEHWLNL